MWVTSRLYETSGSNSYGDSPSSAVYAVVLALGLLSTVLALIDMVLAVRKKRIVKSIGWFVFALALFASTVWALFYANLAQFNLG